VRRRSWWAFVVLVIAAAVWLVPVIYMVNVALRTQQDAFVPSLLTLRPTWGNFRTVLGQPSLPRYFLNSLIIAVGTTAFTIAIGASAAYAFARMRVPGGRALFPLLLFQLFVPLAALLIPIAQLLKFFGLVNTYWGLIGPETAIGVPFALIVFRGAMDGFPNELEEAARIDGCTRFAILVRIVFPLVSSATLVVAINQFLYSWNEFFLALIILTRAGIKTLPLAPLVYQSDFISNVGELFAILTLITLPPVVAYALLQRRFVQGLQGGGIKE